MTYIGASFQNNSVQLSHETCRRQVERILASTEFSASQRRRDLFQYLVDETLAGHGDQLKGYTIATGALGRSDDFDSQSDPVVRIEARRLRRDLDSYYGTSGRDDPIHISIPKGAYSVLFEKAKTSLQSHYEAEPHVDVTAGPEYPAAADPVQPPDAKLASAIALRRPKFGWIAWPVPVAFVALLVGVFAWGYRVGTPNNIAQTSNNPKILVLPFKVLDPGSDTKLFAGSITHDLIADLMRFPDFRLYSSQSSLGLDADADPIELGRELGVAFVVHGNVQTNAGKLRLGAQLSEMSTGQVLWSGSYDRTLTPNDLFVTRRELSSTLAAALGERYGVVNMSTTKLLIANDIPSMASYACVLRADEYRYTFEDELFEPAFACLKDAVFKEPEYADAWAMLGLLHLEAARQDMVPAVEHPAHMASAENAATRSLELDPSNQRGLLAVSAIRFSNGDYAEAERTQREALAGNPYDPEILAQLGWRLAVRGNWDDGVPFLEEAIARSTNPPGWYFHLISVHNYIEGDYVAAVTAGERSAKNGSAIGLLLTAISQAKLGNMDEASVELAEMAAAWPLLGRDPATALGNFQVDDEIVAKLVEGMRAAGWSPTEVDSP